ncbi:MAG: NAD(P)/FAD-dependent oxidoreductase [Planctomycetota bacterium]|jgi:protoporphyrinogen oxidase
MTTRRSLPAGETAAGVLFFFERIELRGGLNGMSAAEKTAVIIGAGPAGLTAAYELLGRTDIRPVGLEARGDIGGISKTVNYKGNRIDIGGHRFFSKSQRVLDWWFNILPLQGRPARDDIALGREVPLSPEPDAPDPEKTDKVLLARQRVSRIFFLDTFFDYPLSLNLDTLSKLGVVRTSKIVLSYVNSRLFAVKPETSLEDFFINRFGRELYGTFFRDYTEKVWGAPCTEIGSQWGAQRVKGMSVRRALIDAARNVVRRDRSVGQKHTETSLIRQFLYPKLGPGQMWSEVAERVERDGGRVRLHHRVVGLTTEGQRVTSVRAIDERSGASVQVEGDYLFSSMPVRDLIAALGPDVPGSVREVAQGLLYRDFITVGLLLKRLRIQNSGGKHAMNGLIPDCWIYIQDPSVRVGRMQIFNNWSPYLVADPDNVWIGLEYFCSEGDALWAMPDHELSALAAKELKAMGFAEADDVLEGMVLRTPKAYPAYFGTYSRFDVIRTYTDPFENLFLVGRNGMHRYNNQDHSMLTAMTAVENICADRSAKDNIWSINTEDAYHEKQSHSKVDRMEGQSHGRTGA